MTNGAIPHDAPLQILAVCTGNVCRSPLTERLLQARLGAAGVDAAVTSAGTSALVLEDMTPETSALVVRYGGDPSAHRARQLSGGMVASADLVLTATREHRSAVVSMLPRAARYTYTLAQFARLVDGLRGETSLAPTQDASSAKLRELIVGVAAMRGFVPPPEHPEIDDVEDPYRRAPEVYNRVGAAIDLAVESIVARMSNAVGRA